jgi:uncharacterized protein (DUF1330 family)
MAAYLIADVDVHDAAEYEKYKAAIPALIRKHGGETLARGGAVEVFEGEWKPHRLVLFRFPALEAIRAFLNDPEYRPWKELRLRISKGNLVGIEGV